MAAYGALGLLWVGQAQALEVTPPGEIVRDSVRATLEAEVGTIMGGAAYQRVRPRIDSQFADYWTSTGRPGARQSTARTEHDAAERAATEAATRLAALEQGFADLEAARARLKLLDRDLADTADADRRRVLVDQVDVARSAAQLRDTRRAEQGRLADQVKALEELTARLVDARKAVSKTVAELASAFETDLPWKRNWPTRGSERVRRVIGWRRPGIPGETPMPRSMLPAGWWPPKHAMSRSPEYVSGTTNYCLLERNSMWRASLVRR
ncbi:hypothetical protein [Sphingomonas sp. CFBP 13733]|uniref:hypothetical protein n=1 Tax=Sphingomonas sp. CFBP 13733 TaxID=2775291 RepID=UPI001786A7E5|nr:hypothetical protein [Sphingomonas sp. CFBP 13733]MBD8641493.1 hypothetical protein [Sphingomonas sp. CFBP 13733]